MPSASLSRAYNPRGPSPLTPSVAQRVVAPLPTRSLQYIVKDSPAVEKYPARAKLFLAHMGFPTRTKETHGLTRRRAGA
jgi:hypothetical protein